MRAFLSHSSKDAGYVDAVAATLRPGTYELDSETFDRGVLNSQAILAALRRCDLFCLFLSARSVDSRYVDFETLLGIELLASGNISRFLAICLDTESFEMASAHVKHFNVVRIIVQPDTAARMIEGHLISLAATTQHHVFIGREEELKELGGQITDYSRPPPKALYLSGNYGSGRRTIGRKVYGDYFPSVNPVFPVLRVGHFAGPEELYRSTLSAFRPTMQAAELLDRVDEFRCAECSRRAQIIASEINALTDAREAVFVLDEGGLLTASGSLVPEFNDVIDHLSSRPHPPVVFVSPRMIPRRLRRKENDLSYLAVRSLSRDATERIISALLREREIAIDGDELERLVDLSDSHPFNIYRMVEEVADSGPGTFLASPADFIDWKHRQSSEYVGRVDLSEIEIRVLCLLKLVPQLDLTAIVNALEMPSAMVSEALINLTHLHIVEGVNDRFMIAPPIRVAVERDRRIELPRQVRREVTRRLADSLSMRLEEGTAPVVLIDSTILACLHDSDQMPQFVSAFLLPSHQVWMARNQYDLGRWGESMRYARRALEAADRLSASGTVGACRYLCLAAARLQDRRAFNDGIGILRSIATDRWAESNIAFLEGFNLRLRGELPEAEERLRQAYKLLPGNFSAAREIASVCLARGNLSEGERFAREAHQHAPRNPYVADILVSILIRKYKDSRADRSNVELEDMLDLLAQVGEESGKSFYTTRRAEYEHLCGDNMEAMRLIEAAIKRTPMLFEPQRLYAEILLKAGNLAKAGDVVKAMERIVNSRRPEEGKSNLREFLQTKANYLIEIGRYEDAKAVFSGGKVFTDEEREEEIRKVGIAEGFRRR